MIATWPLHGADHRDDCAASLTGDLFRAAFVTSGGLLYYGSDRVEQHRRAASYVDRILSGEKAGDLPLQQPTKYVVINLKTAKRLGLTIPESFLLRADEVID